MMCMEMHPSGRMSLLHVIVKRLTVLAFASSKLFRQPFAHVLGLHDYRESTERPEQHWSPHEDCLARLVAIKQQANHTW